VTRASNGIRSSPTTLESEETDQHRRLAPSTDALLFQIDRFEPTPAYIQLERRIRVAVADGALQPEQPLPSVRELAKLLSVSPNTVGRAYAHLSREGVLLARAGGGSAVAPRERLDHQRLQHAREERLQVLSRQTAVRGLALGFEPTEIVEALKRELALHGHSLPATVPTRPLGHDEASLVGARNRLRGVISDVRCGELMAEVTLDVGATQVVAALTRTSRDRLALEPGCKASAYLKATDVTLAR